MIRFFAIFVVSCSIIGFIGGCASHQSETPTSYKVANIEPIEKSEKDVLGEEALKQPGGPNYEYFRDLMPPLRYVDANFHVYPITLSAPTCARAPIRVPIDWPASIAQFGPISAPSSIVTPPKHSSSRGFSRGAQAKPITAPA